MRLPVSSTWFSTRLEVWLALLSTPGAISQVRLARTLRRHGEKIASRGAKNAKKRAVVAVSRKLSVLLHRLWVSAEIYEPLRNTHRRQEQEEGGSVEERRWSTAKHTGGEDTGTQRRGDPKVADGHG
jgi:hypothetical protein